MRRLAMILGVNCSCLLSPLLLHAKERNTGYFVKGPVSAEVIRVVDGDTVEVRAFPWPQQSVQVLVRLRGIDAPETRTKCLSEKTRGYAARDALQNMLKGIRSVSLTNISGGKYFGRILANVKIANRGDASTLLLKTKLVAPYQGGKKSKPSCASNS